MSLIHLANRRDFLRLVLGGVAGSSFTFQALGQAPSPITATKLSDHAVLLAGDGGNVLVVLGDDSVMMVDGGLPDRAPDLQKAIRGVDVHPVQLMFNTHWHFDHTGSNELLGKSGVKIMAHENVKKWLSTKVTVEALNHSFDPAPPEARPAETFTKSGKMTFGKEKIVYVHTAPAHTDSDTYVFLPDSNVVHCGDLFFNGFYPVIDYSTGGWIGGMAAASEALLKVGDANTRIIPGHGPLGSKSELKLTHDMLATVFQRMEPMAKQGKSVEEVVAAAPTKDFDARFGTGGMLPPPAWTRVAYTSILRHNQKS